MLVDYDAQTMLVVDPEQKQILDMSNDLPARPGRAAPALNMVLVPQGTGPVMAGYATKKYTLKSNNKVCGTTFGSKAAMQITGVSRLFDSMKTMAAKQRAAMGGYAGMVNACTLLTMDFASQTDMTGVPMKMVDNRGNVISEIISINTHTILPEDAFSLPQGYKQFGVQNRKIRQPRACIRRKGKCLEGNR